MSKSPKEMYAVPEWMHQYLPMFNNTGGNSVESLLHDEDTNMFANSIRYMLIVSARSQYGILMSLHENGLLPLSVDLTATANIPKSGYAMSNAAIDVLAERARQVEAELWTPEHDDEHVCDEIAAFAALYAMPEACRDWEMGDKLGYGDTLAEAICPEGWEPKFGDRRRELIKAAALTIAEIERLDRQEAAR